MYQVLLHSHSGLRYITLLFIVISIIKSIKGLMLRQKYNNKNLRFDLISMTLVHIQLVVGLALYYLSPKVLFSKAMIKVELFRFYTLEHITVMLLAVALITVGYIKAKRNLENAHKNILICFIIAILIILWAIPWPFKANLGGGWI